MRGPGTGPVEGGGARFLLRSIGFWGDGRDRPHPRSLVDHAWDGDERQDVADHLRRGFVARACMGRAFCRLCGVQNGSSDLTDGHYIWPEGLAHYVTEHHVRLPQEFVAHVSGFTKAHEDAVVDESWWVEAGRRPRIPFVDHLAEWVDEERDGLSALGSVVHRQWLREPKPGALLMVVPDGAPDVELLIWASGEADFNRGPHSDPVLEHVDLQSELQLSELLARFLAAVRAARG